VAKQAGYAMTSDLTDTPAFFLSSNALVGISRAKTKNAGKKTHPTGLLVMLDGVSGLATIGSTVTTHKNG
jgi:hypothetical protein